MKKKKLEQGEEETDTGWGWGGEVCRGEVGEEGGDGSQQLQRLVSQHQGHSSIHCRQHAELGVDVRMGGDRVERESPWFVCLLVA